MAKGSPLRLPTRTIAGNMFGITHPHKACTVSMHLRTYLLYLYLLAFPNMLSYGPLCCAPVLRLRHRKTNHLARFDPRSRTGKKCCIALWQAAAPTTIRELKLTYKNAPSRQRYERQSIQGTLSETYWNPIRRRQNSHDWVQRNPA